MGLVVLEIVWLEALLLDAAEGLAELAHKVVLLQVRGDVVLPKHQDQDINTTISVTPSH